MRAGDWILLVIIVWVFSSFVTKFTELPIVQINTDGECVRVIRTDVFACGFLPDRYITEHVE